MRTAVRVQERKATLPHNNGGRAVAKPQQTCDSERDDGDLRRIVSEHRIAGRPRAWCAGERLRERGVNRARGMVEQHGQRALGSNAIIRSQVGIEGVAGKHACRIGSVHGRSGSPPPEAMSNVHVSPSLFDWTRGAAPPTLRASKPQLRIGGLKKKFIFDIWEDSRILNSFLTRCLRRAA